MFTACGGTDNSAQQQEDKNRQNNYKTLTERQPAGTMGYSPTRETKNFWIKTWGQKGKKSYVYLFSNDGKVLGYYVLDGLPVNYCTSLIPPYQFVDPPGDGDPQLFMVPGPSVDGTFNSGSDCNTFYGKDAVSGAYIQYTAGLGLNPLLYDQPLSPGIVGDAPNLGNVK